MTSPARKAAATEPVEHVVSLLREPLYGAISCLATGGLWAASLLADWVAHLGVYRTAPHGRAWLRMLQSSAQILEAAVLPIVVLAVAGFGGLDTDTATWIAAWILVVELGVITLLAVRRTELPWWQQALAVAGLVGVGVLVLGIKILAH